MTTNDLHKYAYTDLHAAATEFLWYNGDKIVGRIYLDLTDPQEWYYFLDHSYYNPGRAEKPDLTIQSNFVRRISSPNCIELYDRNKEIENYDRFPPVPNDVKFKKMIIIGAGASYDFEDKPQPSVEFPLSNDLFASIDPDQSARFEGVQRIANELTQSGNIENKFQQIWERLSSGYNEIRIRDLINVQFYLHNLFFVKSTKAKKSSYSNYQTLGNAIQDWSAEDKNDKSRIAIVNYNYDLLMDYALRASFDINFDSIEKYVDARTNSFAYFRPHGACNWVRRFSPHFHKEIGTTSGQLTSIEEFIREIHKRKYTSAQIFKMLESSIDIAVPEEHQLLQPLSTSTVRPSDIVMSSMPYYPHLLIPHSKKDNFLMPNGHVGLLRTALSQVDEILVIGWKGEEDGILKLMREECKKPIKVTIVGRYEEDYEVHDVPGLSEAVISKKTPKKNKDRRIIANLTGNLSEPDFEYLPIGFSGYAKEIAKGNARFFS
jgi:hypothetical protein